MKITEIDAINFKNDVAANTKEKVVKDETITLTINGTISRSLSAIEDSLKEFTVGYLFNENMVKSLDYIKEIKIDGNQINAEIDDTLLKTNETVLCSDSAGGWRSKIKTVNPVESAKIYRRGKPNIKLLTKDEIKTFLSSTCNSDSWYLEILLALFCGLRKGEIRGLKFSDFNYEKKTVSISRQLANKYELSSNEFKIEKLTFIEKDPKTSNSFRTLRVPDIIWKELEKRKRLVELHKMTLKDDYIDNDYISCQDNGLPHGGTSLNKYIENQCKKNSIPKISVHGLRHLYATILIEQGVPIPKISALLGHSSVHTTFDFYLDVISEKERITAFMNNTFAMKESEE